jgi:hypothetical protein
MHSYLTNFALIFTTMRNNSCYTLTVTDILVFIVVKHIVGHLVQRMKLTAFEKSSL